jgi:hypothetical protein
LPFANKASPDARVRLLTTWMKTTNTEFESQFSYERLHVSFAPNKVRRKQADRRE